jgi:hypothetical protein
MISLRILFRLLPVALLLAAAPAVALPSPKHDAAAIAIKDAGVHSPKPADHASKKPRPSATLEESFDLDDDAEQDFKPQPMLVYDVDSVAIGSRILVPSLRLAPRTHRVCAAFPTGPPHA